MPALCVSRAFLISCQNVSSIDRLSSLGSGRSSVSSISTLQVCHRSCLSISQSERNYDLGPALNRRRGAWESTKLRKMMCRAGSKQDASAGLNTPRKSEGDQARSSKTRAYLDACAIVEESARDDDNRETLSKKSTKVPLTQPVVASSSNCANDVAGQPSAGLATMQQVLKAVVKVFVTSTSPNYSMPWQMKHQSKSTSSGFVIEGRRILTNAHAVAHESLVFVRKHGNPKKFVAKVLAVGHECDMAMMTVEDDEFWEGVLHLELDSVPQLQEVVTVVGYPTGGDNVSVTKGVVSRLEIQQYSHASQSLLAIQIDAAINAGNSGGPALKDDKVIGIAFESLESAENIGYIIPVPVIEHFLEDIARHGKYTGFCSLGIVWQVMENTDMRAYYRMSKEQTGVFINRVQPLSSVCEVVKPGDILLAFDGSPIADDGTVAFRSGERIDFSYLVTRKFAREVSRLTLLRDGVVIEVEASMSTLKPLIPVHLYDLEGPPSYFIYAGLVFLPCSQAYLRSQYGKDWEMKAPLRLCEKAAAGILEDPAQEAVLLSQVLAAEINTGYQNMGNVQVIKCNDVYVKNLKHLAKLVLHNPRPHLTLDLDRDKRIVIDMKKANAVTESILRQNYIPAPYPQGFVDVLPSNDDEETSGMMSVADELASVLLRETAGSRIAVPASDSNGDGGMIDSLGAHSDLEDLSLARDGCDEGAGEAD
eukprot:jgi/Mesen1/5026/ME000025S04425